MTWPHLDDPRTRHLAKKLKHATVAEHAEDCARYSISFGRNLGKSQMMREAIEDVGLSAFTKAMSTQSRCIVDMETVGYGHDLPEWASGIALNANGFDTLDVIDRVQRRLLDGKKFHRLSTSRLHAELQKIMLEETY